MTLHKPGGRVIGVGFRRWKAVNLKPLLALESAQVIFVRHHQNAAALGPTPLDRLVHWGRDAPAGLADLAGRSGASLLRMEDGFIRSVGLGSDLIRPMSVVLDKCGIYFDPTQPSDLEQILDAARFTRNDLSRARDVRAMIVKHGITKYNHEPRGQAEWPTHGKEVVLVPGQVEDDASIRYGCPGVRTNLELLQATRDAHPGSFIVFKPHPDVMSGNRAGKLALSRARQFADHVEAGLSVVSCIEACDVLHTMTSLAGFDALMRGKRVVTHGLPFYAGWGLTEDMIEQAPALERRRRRLTLDELVAGTLLVYPIYWDWELNAYTNCEAVLRQIVCTRDALVASGGLEKLRVGFIRRQWRKLVVLSRAWLSPLLALRW